VHERGIDDDIQEDTGTSESVRERPADHLRQLIFGDERDLDDAARWAAVESYLRTTSLNVADALPLLEPLGVMAGILGALTLVTCWLGRHDHAALTLGLRVVGLAEVHDVDAVRAERGSDRRRGGSRARLNLNLHARSNSSFSHYYSLVSFV